MSNENSTFITDWFLHYRYVKLWY